MKVRRSHYASKVILEIFKKLKARLNGFFPNNSALKYVFLNLFKCLEIIILAFLFLCILALFFFQIL